MNSDPRIVVHHYKTGTSVSEVIGGVLAVMLLVALVSLGFFPVWGWTTLEYGSYVAAFLGFIGLSSAVENPETFVMQKLDFGRKEYRQEISTSKGTDVFVIPFSEVTDITQEFETPYEGVLIFYLSMWHKDGRLRLASKMFPDTDDSDRHSVEAVRQLLLTKLGIQQATKKS